ncbi:MAG: phage baseplate assembly protein [Fibrobacter sp.]|nr:phage baseplate assembly protein [Fibrobacter sp.]
MNFDRLLSPIKSRLRLMIARAVVVACKDKHVKIDLLAGESREDVDFFQQYGFSSRPKGSVDAVAVFVGGSRDNGVVVASRGEDDNMGISLEPGEVAMHSSFGSSIILKKDGSVMIKTNTGKPLRVEGDVHVVGKVLSTDEIAAKCKDVPQVGLMDTPPAVHLSSHSHNSAVGPTSPPSPGS